MSSYYDNDNIYDIWYCEFRYLIKHWLSSVIFILIYLIHKYTISGSSENQTPVFKLYPQDVKIKIIVG